MSLQEFTRSAGHKIGPLGAGFMLDPSLGTRAEEIGLDYATFYFLGRGGVLGDVDGSVVADAFGFFNPDVVTLMWNQARETMSPVDAVGRFTEWCRDWGRAHITGVEGLNTFAGQCERIAAAADGETYPLLGGWRDVPLPDDDPGRAYQLVHVLREHRGACHVQAVRKVGLEPVEAMTMNTPHMIALFGWPGPVEDTPSLRERAAEAEDITDELASRAFAALGEDERDSFEQVLDACVAAAGV